MREIPKKNYIILAVIVFLTIFAVFYVRNWYVMAREYNSDNSPMLKVINEINPDEISNYVLENPKFILYTSSGLNTNIKGFESKFKNYVLDRNMNDYMVYINTANTDIERLRNILIQYTTNDMANRVKPSDNVSIYVFENGRIAGVINKVNELDNKTIGKILNGYGVLDA
ncbi:MAG: hypothetical protein IKE75_04745 [Bacilli bacterium]|nr:hypothetical protein [Bacilli bacterium]